MNNGAAPGAGTGESGVCGQVPRLPVRKLFDHPLRDTSINSGPDGWYYLTGTTGHPGWWNTNHGIDVWRSQDLQQWDALGTVWSLEKDATWQQGSNNPEGKWYRAVWAPELHYFKGTFWIAYCMNYGGTGVLKSVSGVAEGPYRDIKSDGPLTSHIDASLFQDVDGQVYFVWQNGMIARMKEDMSGLAEAPRQLKPSNADHVGFEGAFIVRMGGRYQLICAEFNQNPDCKTYDCMVASADSLYGPYGERYLAIPQAGHNMFFEDRAGQWWSTFFGNDPRAPWMERGGILPIELGPDGRVHVQYHAGSAGQSAEMTIETNDREIL